MIEELQKPNIPVEYKSGFTFFDDPTIQKEFYDLKASELAIRLSYPGSWKTQYIYELWRIGRMNVVYEYFRMVEESKRGLRGLFSKKKNMTIPIPEDDIVFNTTTMFLSEQVSFEEARAFLRDLFYTAAIAREKQEFGNYPLNPQPENEKVGEIVTQAWTNVLKYPPEE